MPLQADGLSTMNNCGHLRELLNRKRLHHRAQPNQSSRPKTIKLHCREEPPPLDKVALLEQLSPISHRACSFYSLKPSAPYLLIRWGGWLSPLLQGDVGPIEFCWMADDKGHPLGAASDQAAHLDLYLKGHLTLLISASTTPQIS